MQVMYEVCCGLDVHKKSVTARVLWASWRRQTRQFETFTKDLLELSDWLWGYAVTHVALESTGVYWKPVGNLLEGQFQVLLVNAQHITAVPERKTDQKDSEWIPKHGPSSGTQRRQSGSGGRMAF
jgi:transposase